MPTHDLDAHGSESLAVAQAAGAAADDIEQIKSRLSQLRDEADRLGMIVDPVTNTVEPGPGAVGATPMEITLKQMQLQPELDAIIAEAARIDQELARAINMAIGESPIPDAPDDNRPEIQEALGKPLREDPQQFNDLWEQLTTEQKDWLYDRDHSIGNHPGMPFVDKNIYNRQHLDELMQTTQGNIDQMQQRYDELARQVYMGDHSAATGNEMAALGPQLAAARHQMDGHKAVNGVIENKNGAPRLLAMVDDQGHTAVSIGNPDTASHTATFVPGTGQDLGAFQGSDRKSEEMFRATLNANTDLTANDVAVTTWMGYDRPMNLGEAAFPGRAETGGAGNLSLAEGADVYSMTARNDIISLATDATLGADPFATDFGATRLNADPGPSWDPTGIVGSVDAHSSYWDSQSNPALENMGAIIAGLPPSQIVTPEGGVAPGS